MVCENGKNESPTIHHMMIIGDLYSMTFIPYVPAAITKSYFLNFPKNVKLFADTSSYQQTMTITCSSSLKPFLQSNLNHKLLSIKENYYFQIFNFIYRSLQYQIFKLKKKKPFIDDQTIFIHSCLRFHNGILHCLCVHICQLFL